MLIAWEEQMIQHSIVHIELSARDSKAAGDFYGQLFGWKIEAIPEMNYVTFEITPELGGGFLDIDDQETKAGDIIPYISTDDIKATLVRVESLGGKTLTSKTEIPGIGWYALFADPAGNRIGLYSGLSE
jgi:predicted enzyme related to lactoylglutathione lyase